MVALCRPRSVSSHVNLTFVWWRAVVQNLKKKERNKIHMLGNKSINHKFGLKVLWKMYTITECVLTLVLYTCPQVVVLWLQSGVPDQTPYHQGCISSQVNFHSVQILFHRIHHTGLLLSLNKKLYPYGKLTESLSTNIWITSTMQQDRVFYYTLDLLWKLWLVKSMQ